MNILLYKCNNRQNDVNKELREEIIIENVRLLDNVNILNPELRFGSLMDIVDYIGYNYVYIPKFQRYYFVENMEYVKGFCIIKCAVDVLYTYKTHILNSTQLVTRQENTYNKFIADSKLIMNNRNNYDCYAFPVGFTTGNTEFVLQVAGKP